VYLVLSMICLTQLANNLEYLNAASWTEWRLTVLKKPFKSNSYICISSVRFFNFSITANAADQVPLFGLNPCCISLLYGSLNVTHRSVNAFDITLLPTVGLPIGLNLPFGFFR